VVSAQVKNHGYSQLLERATVDFGADGAFARAPQKLKEHYGIEIPISAAQQITEKHGAEILQFQSGNRKTEIPLAPGVACVIAQLDGSMVPIVNTAEPSPEREKVDRRRTRQLEWQEARLAMAHEAGSVTPRFAATLGGVEQAGKQWLDCVLRAGAGTETFVHCVGDGATWIFHQMELQFGTQARYLVDFSHLSEYLSAAADSCAADSKQVWLRNQQQCLKENHSDQVVDELAGFLEREKPLSGEMPVTACYRYLVNRPGQFDYQGALAAGLPIGSGEIESGHRYVIQARLKIAGAWWKEDNAEKMLALRVLRANQDWEHYWQNRNQKAA
jgi:hypothetical protein